ncbi:MAG: glycoside hydrolase [Acidobacterium ailaaui]|nr:glycoside hydrolase [Pseudacidobacterium ailaaui]
MKKYLLIFILLFQSFQLFAKDYPAALFNIYSDGITLNTNSIQFAIDYIHAHGGGRLVFNVGRYLTGSIFLKSNVTLHLEEGAVLLGSLNPLDYQKNKWTALVFAFGQHNIGITGKGIIDGQGQYVARNVINIIGKGLMKDALRDGRPEAPSRPVLIYFDSCSNILIQGITLRNSSSWVELYDHCSDLKINNIHVDSKSFWNNDGIDIADCQHVVVTDSYIDSDDDGICLKSFDDNSGCDDVLIQNNTIRSSASAIKFGTNSSGGFRNICIVNNKVFDTYRSAIALEAVDGGNIENVSVDSLQVLNTGNLIFLRIGEREPGRIGKLENVQFNNITAEIASEKPDMGYEYEGPIENMPRNISPAIIIAGLSGSNISNISFKNITVQFPGGGNPFFAKVSLDSLSKIPELPKNYPEFSMFGELPAWGIFIRHADHLQFDHVNLFCQKNDYRNPVVLVDVQNTNFVSLKIKEQNKKKEVYLYKSNNISIK